MVKLKKLRGMSADELNKQLGELKLELSKERAAAEVGTVKNPGRIGSIRQTIARIHTINKEKEMKGAPKKIAPQKER
jgi:large subunit ribosomal protein L29